MTLTLHKATGQLQHPEFLKAFSDVRYNNKLSSFPPAENRTATYYDHFDPRKYQLIAALCLSEWLIQNNRLFRLLFAQYKNYIVACYLCSLVGIRLNR